MAGHWRVAACALLAVYLLGPGAVAVEEGIVQPLDALAASAADGGGGGETPLGFSWHSCMGTGAMRVSVQNLTVSPLPVVSDAKANCTVNATLTLSGNDPITNGTLDVALSYGGVPVHQGTWSLCDFFPAPGSIDGEDVVFDCPIKPGNMVVSSTFTFPNLPYSGSLSGVSHLTDQDGNEIGCISFSLPVTPSSSHDYEF